MEGSLESFDESGECQSEFVWRVVHGKADADRLRQSILIVQIRTYLCMLRFLVATAFQAAQAVIAHPQALSMVVLGEECLLLWAIACNGWILQSLNEPTFVDLKW